MFKLMSIPNSLQNVPQLIRSRPDSHKPGYTLAVWPTNTPHPGAWATVIDIANAIPTQ